MILTVKANIIATNVALDGIFAAYDAHGNLYSRPFSVEFPEVTEPTPPVVAERLRFGVIETAAAILGTSAPSMHGWSMPYRSEDGISMVLEFDFDGTV